jgi:hypothetical protein
LPQEFDLANDEEAKRRWQRAKPEGMVVGLPGFLVGGEWVGVSTSSLETGLIPDDGRV